MTQICGVLAPRFKASIHISLERLIRIKQDGRLEMGQQIVEPPGKGFHRNQLQNLSNHMFLRLIERSLCLLSIAKRDPLEPRHLVRSTNVFQEIRPNQRGCIISRMEFKFQLRCSPQLYSVRNRFANVQIKLRRKTLQ